MRDPEFDRYLESLSRLLRLSRREREEIRRELAAHVDEFVEAEVARGVSRREAVQRALEDFGDAAALAARFHHPGLRKRWIMHATAAAAFAGVAALSWSFLSSSPMQQVRPAEHATRQTAEMREVRRNDRAAEGQDVEAALERVLPEVRFESQPLDQAVEYVRDALKANVVVYWQSLSQHGIERDAPVTLTLRNISIRRLLDFMLDDLEDSARVTYAVQDGVLVIGPRERIDRDLEVVVYDVHALVHGARAARAPRAAVAREQAAAERAAESRNEAAAERAPRSRNEAAAAERAAREADAAAAERLAAERAARAPVAAEQEQRAEMDRQARAEESRMAEVGRERGPAAAARAIIAGEQLGAEQRRLQELIQRTVQPEAWEVNGGVASLSFYEDALVVRASAPLHAELQRLLAQLEELGRRREARVGGQSSGGETK